MSSRANRQRKGRGQAKLRGSRVGRKGQAEGISREKKKQRLGQAKVEEGQ